MLRNLGFVPKAVGSHRRILSRIGASYLPSGNIAVGGLEELVLEMGDGGGGRA